MPFLINCDNKGCGKQQEPVLEPETNEVFCTECGKTIQNITQFARMQMKSMGQVRKPQKTAYSFKCAFCKKDGVPKLSDDKLICAICTKQFVNISRPFEILVKNFLKTKDKEEL